MPEQEPAVAAAVPVSASVVRPASSATQAHVLPIRAAGRVPVREIATLSADGAARVAEMVQLQQFAAGTGLELTAEQWSALAELTAYYQAVRHAYEASIATVAPRERARARVEVPAYAVAGDALRARFYAEVQEKLGATAGAEIAQRLGPRLEGYFGGFGVSVQTLDFVADERSGGADYQVLRTVKYWDSVEAGERLTVRREVHFPGLEDPAGQQWGPFLSVLASGAGAPGAE